MSHVVRGNDGSYMFRKGRKNYIAVEFFGSAVGVPRFLACAHNPAARNMIAVVRGK